MRGGSSIIYVLPFVRTHHKTSHERDIYIHQQHRCNRYIQIAFNITMIEHEKSLIVTKIGEGSGSMFGYAAILVQHMSKHMYLCIHLQFTSIYTLLDSYLNP